MSRAIEYIRQMEHGVIIAVGSGKQGKSCSLHSLLAYCWPQRPKYMLDPMEYDISMFPGYTSITTTAPTGMAAVAWTEV